LLDADADAATARAGRASVETIAAPMRPVGVSLPRRGSRLRWAWLIDHAQIGRHTLVY
jgi:hypothetical protein